MIATRYLLAFLAIVSHLQIPTHDTRHNDQCTQPFESFNPTKSIDESGLKGSFDEAVNWLKCMADYWPPARAFCVHIQKKREDGKYRVGPMVAGGESGAETFSDGPLGFNADPGNSTVINSALQTQNGNFATSNLANSGVVLSLLLVHESIHDMETSPNLPKERARWHAVNWHINKQYWELVLSKLLALNRWDVYMQKYWPKFWDHLCDNEKKANQKILG